MSETSVLEIPNAIHDAVMRVAPLVARMRAGLDEHADHHYELEVRLGMWQHKRFVPGINADSLRQIENMLSSFSEWERFSHGWVHSQDYFYEIKGQQYRTSTTFPTDGSRATCVHVFKTMLDHVELQGSALHSDEVLAHVHKVPIVCDLRVGLSTEKEIAARELPPLVTPHLLRFKQRRSFETRGWRFDLTKTWQAKTREEMEQKQAHDPVCEFEIECLNPRAYLSEPFHTDEYVATSILLKALDFVTIKDLHVVTA